MTTDIERTSGASAAAIVALTLGLSALLGACAPETVTDATFTGNPSPPPVTADKGDESDSVNDTTPACHEGEPLRFVWPDLDINASIEHVGLDKRGALAPPKGKDTIGWYAPGWKPGSGHGNIIIEGHTYGDDSAVFKESFGETASEGTRFWFEMDNESRCEYRVTELFLSIDKDEEFPAAAIEHGFFDASGGERVFGVTCSGEIVGDSHANVDAFYAEPVT